MQDLGRALELVGDAAERAEIQLELGVVLRRQRDYRRSVRACRAAVDFNRANAQVLPAAGSCVATLLSSHTSKQDLPCNLILSHMWI